MELYKNFAEKAKYFTCETITSIEQLHSVLKTFQGKPFVFRGVKNAAFMNYSSAQVNTQALYSQEQFNSSIIEAIDLVKHSKRLIRMLKKRSKDETDSEVLALLQHYGFGTPFLDYSYKFNYGVFFALDGMDESYTNDETDINNYCSIYYFNSDDPYHKPFQKVQEYSVESLEECDATGKVEYGRRYKGLSDSTITSYKNFPYKEMCEDFSKGGLTIASRSGGVIKIDSKQTGLHTTYDISNERDDIQRGLFKYNPSSSKPYEVAAVDWIFDMYERNFCLNIHKSLKDILVQEFLAPYNISRETVYPNTKYNKKVIRELLKLPMDGSLRPKSPQNMSAKTLKKYNTLYEKRLSKYSRSK